jgi:hypothetical protein
MVHCSWCTGSFPESEFTGGEWHNRGTDPLPHSRFTVTMPDMDAGPQPRAGSLSGAEGMADDIPTGEMKVDDSA